MEEDEDTNDDVWVTLRDGIYTPEGARQRFRAVEAQHDPDGTAHYILPNIDGVAEIVVPRDNIRGVVYE